MAMSSTNAPLRASRVPKPARRYRDIWLLAGLFALVIVSIVGLAAATGWQETMAQIKRLSGWQILALLGLSLVNYAFRGLRWHLFARRLGLPTGLIQDLRHFLGGFAMSVTPGRVGELVRMRWLTRETGWSFERTAPLMLMDRASDLVAMALILALALALSSAGFTGALPIVLASLIAAYVVTRPRLLAGVATRLYRLTGLWPRLFARIRTAAQSLARFSNPWVIGLAAALGLIGWMAEGVAFYLLLMWMGVDVGLWTAVGIFVFSALAGGLTGAPGGVGGAEAAMIGLLMLEHVPLEVSLPATLIIRVTTLWFAIGIGLMIFPLAEKLSMRAKNALENC